MAATTAASGLVFTPRLLHRRTINNAAISQRGVRQHVANQSIRVCAERPPEVIGEDAGLLLTRRKHARRQTFTRRASQQVFYRSRGCTLLARTLHRELYDSTIEQWSPNFD